MISRFRRVSSMMFRSGSLRKTKKKDSVEIRAIMPRMTHISHSVNFS